MPLPKIVFDTSAVNRLVKDGSRAEPLMIALRCGFDVQVTGMVVSELLSTPFSATREPLIACCQRLLASGRCVWPPHEIIRLLILAHHSDPTRFNWTQVNVRARVYERAIIDRDFDDQLCVQELKEQLEVEEQYLDFWRALGLKIEPMLSADPRKRPKSYAQAVAIAKLEPSVLCGIGQELYAKVATTTPTEAETMTFMDGCPPFRAACYAILGSWYDCSLKHPPLKKPPGRNDHMMAVYLPYCGRFVTRDKKQTKRLQEVVVEAQLNCDVLYYDDFAVSFEAGGPHFAREKCTRS